MIIAHWTAVGMAALYGLVNLLGGASQWKSGQIQRSAAGLMLLCGAALVVAAGLLGAGVSTGFYPLVIGLVGMHGVAIVNGYHLHGKLNPVHHAVRALLSASIAGLAFWAQ